MVPDWWVIFNEYQTMSLSNDAFLLAAWSARVLAGDRVDSGTTYESLRRVSACV